MKKRIEDIIKRLREASKEIGILPRRENDNDTENDLDDASGSIQDAVEKLEKIAARS